MVATAVLINLIAVPAPAGVIERFSIECPVLGDTIGAVVASGGDFDGDGVDDFAYSAPCDEVRGNQKAGRVFVRSGADGSMLKKFAGGGAEYFTGATLAFVGDINGDGKDDLAVSMPGFDVVDGLDAGVSPLTDAGVVKVVSYGNRQPLLTVFGSTLKSKFGSSIAGIADVNGDGVRDLVIADSFARATPSSNRTGAIYTVSGSDGAILDAAFGAKRREEFGRVVTNLGVAASSTSDDLLVTSRKPPLGVKDAGYFQVLPSSEVTSEPLLDGSGARGDELGQTADSDGLGQAFILGAPGRKVGGVRQAGIAVVLDANGERVFEVADTVPQKLANFGAAVAAIGDANADGVADFAVSAPFTDVVVGDQATPRADAGRISVLSGIDGSPLWSIDGTQFNGRIGLSLARGADFDSDGIADVVAGSVGSAPTGRRSAGAVTLLSGRDGSVLDTFVGRTGLETRIFVFGKPNRSRVRSFGPSGENAEVNAPALRKKSGAQLSIAVLDTTSRPPEAGGMSLVVGTGAGGNPDVVILSAADRKTVVDRFSVKTALDGYKGGVNVAAGDLADDGNAKILVAMATSRKRNANVAVFSLFKEGPFDPGTWLPVNTFTAFSKNAVLDTGGSGKPPPIPIEADGVNIFVADVRRNPGLEILVAPRDGLPVVRILDKNGKLIRQWLAYQPETRRGVSLAAGSVDASGNMAIVTVPMSGRPLIRAFDGSGDPFIPAGSEEALAFFATNDDFAGGGRVALADIDFDGKQEILVVLGAPRSNEILAFEVDGTPVQGFTTFAPFAFGAEGGETAIAATDRFIRR